MLAAVAGGLAVVSSRPWMGLEPEEARSIAEGVAKIAPYYVPSGDMPEWMIDHAYCVGQIAGVVLARRMRRQVYGMMQPVPAAAAGGDIRPGTPLSEFPDEGI